MKFYLRLHLSENLQHRLCRFSQTS
jgi:hypothetical protein